MVTGGQIKAALAFLGWSRKRLNEESGVPERTIQRIAEAKGVPSANAQNVAAVASSLEVAGITFLEDDGDGPGVRLKVQTDV